MPEFAGRLEPVAEAAGEIHGFDEQWCEGLLDGPWRVGQGGSQGPQKPGLQALAQAQQLRIPFPVVGDAFEPR